MVHSSPEHLSLGHTGPAPPIMGAELSKLLTPEHRQARVNILTEFKSYIYSYICSNSLLLLHILAKFSPLPCHQVTRLELSRSIPSMFNIVTQVDQAIETDNTGSNR